MSPTVIALLIFGAAVTGCGTIVMLVRDLRYAGLSSSGSASNAVVPIRLERVAKAELTRSGSGPVASFDRWFFRLVRESGLGWTALEATLVAIFAGTVLAAAAFLWREQFVLAGVGMGVGMLAVLGGLALRRARRLRLLQDQLPGALDTLARSLRAGQSVDEAFAFAGSHLPEPLAGEFRFCAHQLTLGLGMPAVMRSLVERVQVNDMRIFTTTLAVHRETGGNLAKVLERLAAVVRERLNYRRQLKAVTGAGRLSAILIAGVGPLLFAYMVLCLPQYLKAMLESSVGQSIFVVAITMQVIGLIWIIRLLRPSY